MWPEKAIITSVVVKGKNQVFGQKYDRKQRHRKLVPDLISRSDLKVKKLDT